jgi:hypothetical protein
MIFIKCRHCGSLTLKNYFKIFLCRRRIKRAAIQWNKDSNYIQVEMDATENGYLMWCQLVWQEIRMYIQIGDQVKPDEFKQLCNRRGFNSAMTRYLIFMIKHVGLGQMLKEL